MYSKFTSTLQLSTTIINIDKLFNAKNEIEDIKSLSSFIKNSIGYDYYNIYKTYLNNLICSCESEKNSFYIQISNLSNYSNIINILYDKIKSIKDIYKINTHKSHNCIRLKSLCDLEFIISLLYKLEKISLDDQQSSFKRFGKELKFHIINTNYKMLPRSIINYSAFKFCIPGYPYETNSRNIYSISNLNENLSDKEKIKIHLKNFNALIDFIYDIELPNKNDEKYELKILKLSYGTMIALIALSAEEMQYESIIRKYYGNGEIK